MADDILLPSDDCLLPESVAKAPLKQSETSSLYYLLMVINTDHGIFKCAPRNQDRNNGLTPGHLIDAYCIELKQT
ncbi:hypothetical protein N7533_011678 [Penicillium manginii]|uniref:uncharacterized protein n=1 Tax=Penicillium manginii TaxID=203109 RepID=UPI002548107B|nr:uncharacterized protein N7533_011678 [Penicillium manginii]KAJ5742269.1 hypothetical protein N7533_011678 [Penicillium manginii]